MNIRERIQRIWATRCEVTGLQPCQHCAEGLAIQVRHEALDAIEQEQEPEPPEPPETKQLSRVQLARMFVRATKEGIAARFKTVVEVK